MADELCCICVGTSEGSVPRSSLKVELVFMLFYTFFVLVKVAAWRALVGIKKFLGGNLRSCLAADVSTRGIFEVCIQPLLVLVL